MATNIGGVSCDIVRGQIGGLKTRLELWQIPGLIGYGAQDLGLGDSEFVFVGIKYDTEANIETWIASMEALQGTVISVEDDWEQTHTNLLAVRVGTPRKTAVIVDGSTDTRGEIRVDGVVLQAVA